MTTIEIITKYFKAYDGKQNEFNSPAIARKIALVEQELGASLPEDYKDFLLHTNGFEGWVYQFYVLFNTVETICEFTVGYCSQFFPWAVHIGGNGAGEMFVIDKRQSPFQFGILPFIGNEEDFLPLGNTFEGFIKRLYEDSVCNRAH